jgi:hypothetical protein
MGIPAVSARAYPERTTQPEKDSAMTAAAIEPAATPFDSFHVSPSDKRRAAAMLASAVHGDRWGLTVTVAEAQRADRVGVTVEAMAVLLVEAVPELRRTVLVDRLRALSAPPDPAPQRKRVQGPVTDPGLYAHAGRLYRVVRTQDGLRLYAKVYDAASGRYVYDPDGVKAKDLRAENRVTEASVLG